MIRLLPAVAILITALALVKPAVAEYAAGLRAYNEGNFESAILELEPLVERGHSGAELMLGVMYLRGQGYRRDEGLAAVWMYKAARKGEAGAQLVLGSQLLYGRGVRRNVREALMWLTLAGESGIDSVAKQAAIYRGDAIQFLNPREVEEALRKAKGFSPTPDKFTRQ
ncbi:MAG: sel1 repeat family protein [Proteobacteria bacterium]|nr:sel1 repeat family protein [Pseudomonadota bacterium]